MSQESNTNKIFHITDFRPIGFRIPKYTETYCSFCRGYLSEPCENCQGKNIHCDIIETNGQCYHIHCHNEIIKKNKYIVIQ